MNTTLEINQLKPTNWSAFKTWFAQTARPFVARWWLWFALIVSPAYLIYFFMQSSLEERINRNIGRYDNLTKEAKAESGTLGRNAYRLGYTAGTVIKNPLFSLASVLLLIALLQFQYQYVFHELFERDALGQRIYWILLLIIWLILVAVLSFWFGS